MAKVILASLPPLCSYALVNFRMRWSTMVNNLNQNQFQKIPAEVYTEIVEVRE